MALRIPSPKALTKPEAYLAYKAGILSRDELKQNLYNPLNNYEGWLAKWCGLLETYPLNEDGTPQCLTDEEGLLAYLCGVTDRYPASNSRPDDARISAYIRYLVSARYTRPDHPLNREEFYLSIIKTQFIPSGDPSSDIVIDGTTKAPFVDVKLYGDTAQNSYTGKNRVAPEDVAQATEHGVTYSIEDGVISLDGTSDSVKNMSPVLFNLDGMEGNPAVSVIPISGSWTGGNIGFSFYDSSNNRVFFQQAAYDGRFFRTNSLTAEQIAQISYCRVFFGATGVFSNFKFRIMLTKSTVIETEFEPYVGGQPSPSPDYPQPIKTVTGLQTVEVQGKNLFDSSVTPEHYGHQTVTGGTDGSMELSVTTSNSNQTWSEFAEYLLQLEPNTTYTLSRKWEVVSGEQYRYAGAIRTHIGSSYSAATTSDKLTFTTDASGVTRLLFYTAYLDQTQGQVSTAVRFYDVLLEKGDTVTSFEQYSKQLYAIDLGKNLLNTSLGFQYGFINNNGDYVSNNTIVLFNQYIEVNSGAEYRFSSSHVNNNMTAVFYDASKQFISRILVNDTAVNNFTTPTNCRYVRLQTNYNASEMSQAIVDSMDLMLSAGSQATTYAPYIELNNLDDTYLDYIWEDGDEWKLHKEVAHVTYNLSVSGIAANNTSGEAVASAKGAFQIFFPGGFLAKNRPNVRLSENLGTYNTNTVIGNADAQAMTDGTFKPRDMSGVVDRIYFRNTAYIGKTGNEMRAILLEKSGGSNFWWGLSTPTDTVITDPDLIDQLNALKQGGAEEGTTYIKVSATDPNLPAKLYVEAPKYD